MRILIAEAQDERARGLKKLLEKHHFLVDVVAKSEDVFGALLNSEYDVIVLNAALEECGGLEVLKQLRSGKTTTPVLLFKAGAGIEDRVEGLEAGADDYLPEPFSKREFLARVKALARRNPNYVGRELTFGDLRLDCNCYEISSGEKRIRLNHKEYQLTELFMQHPHFIFSTEHLLHNIWGQETENRGDVVWTYIGYLRKKLRMLRVNVEIKTVRGAGYSLEESG